MNKRKKQLRSLKPIHFSKYDLWNLFVKLAAINAEALREFKKVNVNSHPAEFANEPDGHEHWHRLIDQMIWSFDQISREYPDDPYNKWFDSTFKPSEWNDLDRSLTKMNETKVPPEVLKASNEYGKRVQESINLYAKYFQSLWD